MFEAAGDLLDLYQFTSFFVLDFDEALLRFLISSHRAVSAGDTTIIRLLLIYVRQAQLAVVAVAHREESAISSNR